MYFCATSTRVLMTTASTEAILSGRCAKLLINRLYKSYFLNHLNLGNIFIPATHRLHLSIVDLVYILNKIISHQNHCHQLIISHTQCPPGYYYVFNTLIVYSVYFTKRNYWHSATTSDRFSTVTPSGLHHSAMSITINNFAI